MNNVNNDINDDLNRTIEALKHFINIDDCDIYELRNLNEKNRGIESSYEWQEDKKDLLAFTCIYLLRYKWSNKRPERKRIFKLTWRHDRQ